ncbi:LacI family transcriptional regulator [Opitutaceae bacterium TAV4]|nr:LacI family transcriptional regulator [Opitutaceae bacterium TAV4]RRK00424.1 LacI family transcriptional regulator [Opitutaceae bacterium TAV3]
MKSSESVDTAYAGPEREPVAGVAGQDGEGGGRGGHSPFGIMQLADVLGISVGTISRALNNRYGVNPKTKARVIEAARRYGYVPNGAARQLKARPSLMVGMFFAPYYGPHGEINPAALGIIEELRVFMRGQGMELQVLHYRGDDEELKAQAKTVNVGVFFGHFEDASFAAVDAVGLPSILYSKRSRHASQVCVLPSTRHCGNQAVQYLAALGHERIALVTGPLVETPFEGYRKGFVEGMAEFRVRLREEWLIELPEAQCNRDGAAAVLLPLLQKKRATERPTAMVFSSDWLALGGRKAAREAGLRVPEDVSVIGYDNLPMSADLDPPLTTFDIHLPDLVQTITRLAAQLGAPQNRGVPPPQHEILIVPDLIKRESCVSLRPALA